jgi:hypothetical protein
LISRWQKPRPNSCEASRRNIISDKQSENYQKYSGIGIGLGMGLAIGAGLGVALGNLTLGVSLGVALGVSFGLIFGNKQAKAAQDSSQKDDGHDA